MSSKLKALLHWNKWITSRTYENKVLNHSILETWKFLFRPSRAPGCHAHFNLLLLGNNTSSWRAPVAKNFVWFFFLIWYLGEASPTVLLFFSCPCYASLSLMLL